MVRVRVLAEQHIRPARWAVTLVPPDGDPAPGPDPTRMMPAHVDDEGRWWPAPAGAVDRLIALHGAVTTRTADRAATVEYGRLLFDALIGAPAWQRVRQAVPADALIELELRWPAEDGALHRHVWELLHDGTGFLALHPTHPALIFRTVPSDTPAPRSIETVPKVLFAVGSSLTDPDIRSGTEFMGVLRGLERGGGWIHPRVLTAATPDSLAVTCARFAPHIVHLIGHGRWDGLAGRGVFTMRSDDGGGRTVDVSAEQLLDAFTRRPLYAAPADAAPEPPTAVMLSVCESGVAYSEGGAPLAAKLVAGGVPLVVAMAGDVADTACRVFTRSVAAAVSAGLPIIQAVAVGRRATFSTGRHDPSPVDWALPALFASSHLQSDFRLVDTERARTLRRHIVNLDLARAPVFCGRDEFFDLLERLLDPDEPLALLVSYAHAADSRFGGTRLLRELGAAALRAGHLPCYVGPFKMGGGPVTVPALAAEINQRICRIRRVFGLPAPAPGPGAVPAPRAVPDDSPQAVADHLRAQLLALAADARATHPDLFVADAVPLLLLDDVHTYDRALDALFDEMLDTTGLAMAQTKLPVALFGKLGIGNGARLHEACERIGSTDWSAFRTLSRLYDPDDSADLEVDLLAYRWWLLHPEPDLGGPTQVFTPDLAGGAAWQDVIRAMMDDSHYVYDPKRLKVLATLGLKHKWFRADDDAAILHAYGIRT